MSDILKEIAKLERELGPLPPLHSREDFINNVPMPLFTITDRVKHISLNHISMITSTFFYKI